MGEEEVVRLLLKPEGVDVFVILLKIVTIAEEEDDLVDVIFG